MKPTKWIFAFSQGSEAGYEPLIRVAVASARAHLAFDAVCLYDGQPSPLTAWLQSQNVEVVFCRSVFRPRLEALARVHPDPTLLTMGTGAFLRFEVPRVARERGWNDEFVLYTDCDVMFQADPAPLLHSLRPRIFAAAPEHTPDSPLHMNSGVMWIRLAGFGAWVRGLQAFVDRHFERLCPIWWDQTALRLYFYPLHRFLWERRIPDSVSYGLLTRLPSRGWKWDDLPPSLNWKPYWGENPAAPIVHFHGLKPPQRPLLEAGQLSSHLSVLDGPSFRAYCALWDEWLERARS